MLRCAFVWIVCAVLGGLPRAQAQADALPPPPGTWPAPPAAWQGPGAPAPYLISARDYELWRIDQELARLAAARPRLFWPVALTAAGGAVTVVGLAGLVAFSSTMHEEHYTWDAEGNRHLTTSVDPADREAMRQSALIMALGTGVLAGGLVMLVPRVHTRRELKAQAAPLRRRRLELLGGAQPGLSFDPHGARATARFTF